MVFEGWIQDIGGSQDVKSQLGVEGGPRRRYSKNKAIWSGKEQGSRDKSEQVQFCLSIMKAGWMIRLEWDQMKKAALNFIVKCLCLLGHSETTVEF